MIGKRVGDALYIHRSAKAGLRVSHREQLARAEESLATVHWTVARLARDHTGFMRYEPFEDAAFPALLEAWRLEHAMGTVRHRDFQKSRNPLILHRKELLVAQQTAGRTEWAALTNDLVTRGLFHTPHLIGRRRAWEERLAAAGLRVEGHTLCLA